MKPLQNIVLIGLMGAGKTTVGRRLSQRIGRPMVDTDQEIEQRCGTSVAVIFEVEGEEGFRRREAKVVEELMAQEGLVVTTGGGAPMDPQNQTFLSRGFVIYLEAEPRLLWTRLKTDQTRPLLTQADDPRAKIDELHALRDPIYRRLADLVVSSTKGSLTQVINQIEARLIDEGLFRPLSENA